MNGNDLLHTVIIYGHIDNAHNTEIECGIMRFRNTITAVM